MPQFRQGLRGSHTYSAAGEVKYITVAVLKRLDVEQVALNCFCPNICSPGKNKWV